MPNALATAASPYLLQHADNPVDWREWGPAALEEARTRDVPICLSIGYAACHWCHVMAHESFEDEETAALMNAHFVNIKVDREERPDIDTIYMQALQMTGEQGGWPLTMFLAPDGTPFWGGTYFPPEPRYGRPSFRQVLATLAKIWRDERFKVEGNRQQFIDGLKKLATPQAGEVLTLKETAMIAGRISREFDSLNGGIGTAPKFPQAPVLAFLWAAAERVGSDEAFDPLVLTLRRISQGGIYDHLAGGFARYSVDAEWLVPHFEKMLYDNAQLLRLLSLAFVRTGDPLFEERVRETVGWLFVEMACEGAFASALDADSEGVEGKFYVWSKAEIEEVLGVAAERFMKAYGVTAEGNWEETNILNRLHEPGLAEDLAERGFLEACRTTLLECRARRTRPGIDDKILTDWNGLLIQGLVEAGLRLGERAWIERAGITFDTLAPDANGDLIHSRRGASRLEIAFLDDYAQMTAAAMALFEATGDRNRLETALLLLRMADARFQLEGGGYALTDESAGNLLVRPCNAHDGPTPSAAGTLALASAKLFTLTGDDEHRVRAERIIAAFAGEARRNPFAHATLFAASLFLIEPVQLVIASSCENGHDDPTARAFAARAPAARTLTILGANESLPQGHPAHGKGPVDGKTAAYFCIGQTCRLPVTDPQACG